MARSGRKQTDGSRSADCKKLTCSNTGRLAAIDPVQTFPTDFCDGKPLIALDRKRRPEVVKFGLPFWFVQKPYSSTSDADEDNDSPPSFGDLPKRPALRETALGGHADFVEPAKNDTLGSWKNYAEGHSSAAHTAAA
jgi:hypothetical protein